MNKKLLICLVCFWFSFLTAYSLLPNTMVFKQVQALFQDKVQINGMRISIVDDLAPTSEITKITKQNPQSVKVDYQSTDDGSGIDYVELWQRDLNSDWEFVESNSQTESNFLIGNLADNVYQWLTIAVDKAGNRQTDDPAQLASAFFEDWQFSTVQIDTQPPSLAFSIPGFQVADPRIDQFEINKQGEEEINFIVNQANSFLVFDYRLQTQTTADQVQVSILLDNKVIYVDGAGERDGWVGDSNWQQVTYPLKDSQGEIKILFSLINRDPNNYFPNLIIRNVGLVEDKAELDDLSIQLLVHDLGSGVKEATIDDEITSDDMENKEFKAVDFMENTTFL